MKKLLLYALFALFCACLFCQSVPYWLWASHAGGTSDDSGRAICLDKNRNSYVTGTFKGTATFGDSTLVSSGNTDIFVAKLDSEGNFIWARKAGGIGIDEGLSIAVDNLGNTYITGIFQATASFGDISITNVEMNDMFVAKLDSEGNFLWANQAGGEEDDSGNGISCDSYGNCYVTGSFRLTCTFGTTTLTRWGWDDMFVAKLDTNGNYVWVKQVGGTHIDSGYAIKSDAEGNCWLTGCISYTAAFDDIQVECFGYVGSDIFVAKLDCNGNWVWAKHAGGYDIDIGYAIDVDAGGNCYVTGNFRQNGVFGYYAFISNGSDDIFITKLDANGEFVWATRAGGADVDKGYGIAISESGICNVTGVYYGVATFGTDILSSNGSTGTFVAKMNPNGSFLWVTSINTSGSDCGYGIATDGDDTGYLTGLYSNSIILGSLELEHYGGKDALVAKLHRHGVFVDDELDTQTCSSGFITSAYPNPFHPNENCTITAELAKGATGNITIYNLRGQLVENYPLSCGQNTINLSGKNLPSGIYLYRLKTQNHTEVRKLVLLR